jgi:hypothetical protein
MKMLYIQALNAIMLVNAGAVKMRWARSMCPRSNHTPRNAGMIAATLSTITVRSARRLRKPGHPRM